MLVSAQQLARLASVRKFAFLEEDEERRYREGIADVDRRLAQIERWLALASASRDRE